MTSINVEKLINLSDSKIVNRQKSKRIMERGTLALSNVLSSKKKALYLPLSIHYIVNGILTEEKAAKEKAQFLINNFSLCRSDITGSATSFIESNGNIKVYVNDLQYDVSIKDLSIKNLSIIWGDAYLEKLHDFSKLEHLKAVIGDCYTTTGDNVDYLKNIDVITGNFYTNDERIIDAIKDIYIGGNIYNESKQAVKVNK